MLNMDMTAIFITSLCPVSNKDYYACLLTFEHFIRQLKGHWDLHVSKIKHIHRSLQDQGLNI